MKCYFYLQSDDGHPVKRGPFEAVDDADARRRAMAELERHPEARAIDIWCDQGELYRVERPVTNAAGAAWANAFRGAASLSSRN